MNTQDKLASIVAMGLIILFFGLVIMFFVSISGSGAFATFSTQVAIGMVLSGIGLVFFGSMGMTVFRPKVNHQPKVSTKKI